MSERYEQSLNFIDKEAKLLTSELNRTIKALDECGFPWEIIYMALHKTVDLSLYEYEVTRL